MYPAPQVLEELGRVTIAGARLDLQTELVVSVAVWRDVRWAALGLGLALVFVTYANLNVEEGEDGGTGPLIVSVLLDLLLAAALFGWLLPRVRNEGGPRWC